MAEAPCDAAVEINGSETLCVCACVSVCVALLDRGPALQICFRSVWSGGDLTRFKENTWPL